MSRASGGVYETIRNMARRVPALRRGYHRVRNIGDAVGRRLMVPNPTLIEATQQRNQAEAACRDAVRRCEELQQAYDALKMAVGDMAGSRLSIPKFWERNYWEPTVQFPLRDYCRAGDVVFDVGANAGGLSILMSRFVGPRGIVCAFEASPRIIAITHENLVGGGCSNVQLYHRAIYHTSHDVISIYAGSHLNDSIYPGAGPQGGEINKVRTLRLDDFVESTKLTPKLIKMDIEGAEFDALRGMEQLLTRAKPLLILQQSPTDMRCHDLLAEHGYVAVDLATYRRIRSPADFEVGVSVANVLYVPGSAAKDPYLDDTPPTKVAHIPASAFRANHGYEIQEPMTLPAGRYVCRADFSASGRDNEIFAGIEVDGEVVIRYHTYTRFMAESYRDWVFALGKPSQVAPYLRFIRGADETLDWRGVDILHLSQFDSLPMPVVD